MRPLPLALALAFLPSLGLAQRLPACDPVGYPPGACGRMPDGCGGFVELRPCPEERRLVVREAGVWTLRGAASPVPAFATRLAGESADASWIYVYSNTPLDEVRVRARYAGGRAGWAYPAPSSTRGAIAWTGVGAPPQGDGAWARIALGVATPAGGPMSGNGVLLHAGTVRFQSPIEVRDGAAVAARGEHSVWIVSSRGFEESRIAGRDSVSIRTGDRAGLRQRLREELLERGLSEAEADALLEARAELLAGDHVLYFLPRDAIERAQPLSITPAPDAVVRVRLIVDGR